MNLYEKIYNDPEKYPLYYDTLLKLYEILITNNKDYLFNNIAISFNGGKDCTVVYYLLKATYDMYKSNTKNLSKIIFLNHLDKLFV